MTEIQRWKSDVEELDPDELFQREQALRRGLPEPRFEREEYRSERRDVLTAAGLLDEGEVAEGHDPPLEEQSVGDHFRRIRGE
jgi:hypothetical protein